MKNIQTHMAWSIAILALLLIGSLSVSWSTLPDIPNIISIALGLSSLVLAIVAIVQAVYGGSTLQISLGKIEAAAERALRATDSVNASAENLNQRTHIFEGIPPTLEALNRRIDELSTNNSEGKISAESSTSAQSAIDYLNLGTAGSNLSLYVALRGAETSKSFDASSIFPHSKYIAGILNGYLVGMRVSKLIDMDYVSGKFFIKNMGPFKRDDIVRYLDSSFETSSSPTLKERVDSYFAGETGETVETLKPDQ